MRVFASQNKPVSAPPLKSNDFNNDFNNDFGSDIAYFKIYPDNVKFDNNLYRQSKSFLITATGDWEIEELL